MTNALLPAYQVNTNGYWTNQLVNPIWVADCSIHNFYRVRYDYPGAGYWVPGSYSTFPKDQWENHGPYFSVYSPPNRQLKIVIVP